MANELNSQVWLGLQGHIYTSAVDAAAPTDLATPGVGWTSVGFTSRDNLPAIGSDGGTSTVLGVWQNAALRSVDTEQAVDIVDFWLAQFSKTGLGLYYGGTGGATATTFEVSKTTGVSKTERGLLVVIEDSSNPGATPLIGFHAPRTSIGRNDSVSIATDAFSELPLRASILNPVTTAYKFAWISPSLALS
jgi:hypothetical protein